MPETTPPVAAPRFVRAHLLDLFGVGGLVAALGLVFVLDRAHPPAPPLPPAPPVTEGAAVPELPPLPTAPRPAAPTQPAKPAPSAGSAGPPVPPPLDPDACPYCRNGTKHPGPRGGRYCMVHDQTY